MSGPTQPVIKVEIDLTSTFFVVIEDLEIGGVLQYETAVLYESEAPYSGAAVFTDVTDDVKRVSVSRGKASFTYEHFEAGTATIEMVDYNSVYMPSNPSSPYFPNIAPMRPIRISAELSGQVKRLFRGYIDNWQIEWRPQEQYARVRITATDATKVITKFDTVFTGADGDTPGQRIDDMLTDKNWPVAFRDIDFLGHATTLVEETADRRSLISSFQDIEFADQGAFFIDGEGKVVWRGRDNAYPTGQDFTISDADTGAATYRQISMTVDDQTLYNFVSITNPLGTEQIASDTTSLDTYQERALIRTDVLVLTDTQALALADFILAKDKDPLERIDRVLVSPLDSAANAALMMGADLLTTARIIRSAPGGFTYQVDVFIIGIEHNITPTDWQTTYNTRHQLAFNALTLAGAGIPVEP
jgi:hypothetical protein